MSKWAKQKLTDYWTHSTHNLGVSNKHAFEVKALDSDYFLGIRYLQSPIKGLHNVKFYSVLNIEKGLWFKGLN